VLVVTNMFPHEADPARGAFVKAQVDALRELGLPVDVMHVRGDVSAGNYWRGIGPLRDRVQSFHADLVYAFYGLTGWMALWQPTPVVLSLAGDDILGTPNGRGGITPKSRLGIGLSQWAARRASVVCVQSEEMRARLWGADLRARSHVIPYGVDPKRFHPGERDQARALLGIPPDEVTVIFPNTPAERRKRIDLAEAAVAAVRETIPEVRLRVVTKVPHASMPEYYRAADCCLLTSDWEGSPNVVKEALLSGLPVVSTDVGDVRTWIALSPESVVSQRTPAAIADGILHVLRQRKRVNPQPFIDAFSSQAVARRMVALFDGALRSARG